MLVPTTHREGACIAGCEGPNLLMWRKNHRFERSTLQSRISASPGEGTFIIKSGHKRLQCIGKGPTSKDV